MNAQLKRPILAGSAFAAVAAAVAIGFALAGGPGGTTAAPQNPPAAGAPAAITPVQLVAYQGDQPAGYTLETVPEGWEVQGVDPGVLTLAPKDAADKDFHSFVGKIAIMLQEAKPDGLTPKPIDIDGTPAELFQMIDGGQTLFVPDGDRFLTIQIWEGLGWSDEEIATFAAGVTVTADAQVSVG